MGKRLFTYAGRRTKAVASGRTRTRHAVTYRVDVGAGRRTAGTGRWREAGVVLLAALVQTLPTTFAAHHQTPARPLDLLGYGLLVAGPVLLWWRLRAPATVLLATFTVVLAYRLLGYPAGPSYIALIVAFLGCAVLAGRIFAYTVLAGGYGVLVWTVPLVTGRDLPAALPATGIAVWLTALVITAEGIRARRAAAILAAERRAAADRARAEQERRRLSEERLQLARELHDVLAHSLGVIHMQSAVTLELSRPEQEEVRVALETIKLTSREALVEVQVVLEALRRPDDSAPLTPTASLSDLDGLLRRARDAGLEVTTRIEGSPVALPVTVDLAAARVIQESLTNVLRHSGGRSADVLIGYGDDDLRLEVTDPGPSRPGDSPGSGTGIAGMRERVGALDGSLQAGPDGSAGFAVRAWLPLSLAPSRVVP